MGVGTAETLVDADQLHQFLGLILDLLLLVAAGDLQRLTDGAADVLAGIQRRIRVLEDDLHLLACLAQSFALEVGHVLSVQQDGARGRLVQVDDGAAQRGLAAAGLADNAQRLSFFNGTCGKIYARCKEKDIRVIGIPKTMDNDLAVTDHSPGFGSAARYMAGSVAEVCCDVEGLPIHIVVIEALGRNAGWVTAAASLATDSYAHGPDLIYLPERAFDEEAFLRDVQKLIDTKGHGVVVASEGLHYADGTPIVEPIFTVGRATYFGDVSAHLANLITKKLHYKARAEKPGLLGRASIAWQSDTDREEAERCGRAAVQAAVSGETGKMVALRRLPGTDYKTETFLADIQDVMMTERKMPDAFINAEGNNVTEAYKDWVRPLLGRPLPKLMDLRSEI